jgi:hypothetical protein
MPAYLAAARRHVRDANHLLTDGRLCSADHLSGFAAECSIKAILTGLAGVPLPTTGPPSAGRARFSHLPLLWGTASLYLRGRAPSATVLSGPNPFKGWNVDDRYEADSTVSQQQATHHLQQAQRLLSKAEQAHLSGTIP